MSTRTILFILAIAGSSASTIHAQTTPSEPSGSFLIVGANANFKYLVTFTGNGAANLRRYTFDGRRAPYCGGRVTVTQNATLTFHCNPVSAPMTIVTLTLGTQAYRTWNSAPVYEHLLAPSPQAVRPQILRLTDTVMGPQPPMQRLLVRVYRTQRTELPMPN